MGAKESSRPLLSYTVPVSESTPGSSPVLRNPKFVDGLVTQSAQGHQTMTEMFEYCFKTHRDRPCLGTKRGSAYVFKTYGEVECVAVDFGAGLLQHCAPGDDGKKIVGIYGKNREEWVVTDIAATLYGIVSVPLYDTLGKDAIMHALRQTQMRCIVTGVPGALNTLRILKTEETTLKLLILWEAPTPELLAEAESHHIALTSFSEVVGRGRSAPQPRYKAQPSDYWTIAYTSGTTGTPKGAVLSHLTQLLGIYTLHDRIPITGDDVLLSWLPLAHSMERNNVTMALYMGAQVCFSSGVVPKLMEEVAEVRPTYFAAVPRIWKRIHDSLKIRLSTTPGIKGSIARKGVEAKLKRLHRTGNPTDPVWDPVAFHDMRSVLGGRCKLGVSGGAPIAKDVMDLLKVCLCIPIVEGYGQTECPGGICVTHPTETESGHVGGPLGGLELRLEGVPELGIATTEGFCGEILVRGPVVFSGYYKGEEMTREAKDSEGWLHTGDIGILLSNGAIKIVDRKKQIFKLSQGEYVAPEKVERVYSNCPLVAQCWLYGDSFQDFCIAFVVPDEHSLEKWAADHSLTGSYEELCGTAELRVAIQSSFHSLATAAGLMSFEAAKRIRVLSRPFTIELDQITPTMKLKRAVLKRMFEREIAEEYAKGVER